MPIPPKPAKAAKARRDPMTVYATKREVLNAVNNMLNSYHTKYHPSLRERLRRVWHRLTHDSN